MNDDGSLVAFDSTATDLVDGDTNEASDVFLWSAETGEVTRASQLPDGQEGNSDSGTMGLNISGDGNWIVFSSLANNLLPGDANLSADVFRLDRSTGAITLVSADVFDRSANGPSYSPFVSDDGNTVAFTSLAGNVVINDRNRNPDVFLRTDNFPEVAGTGEVPSASPGDPALGLPPPTGDDGGVPGWALVAAIVAGVIAALAAGSYLLGRKPAA
jgi:Tol biopolymer transport system component